MKGKEMPETINELLDSKYGKRGSASRFEFSKKAYAYVIAEIVKDARKRANLTQEQLAQKVNLKRPHISRIERGETDIRMSTLQRIAHGLGGELKIELNI